MMESGPRTGEGEKLRHGMWAREVWMELVVVTIVVV
jgi:hypothetical protein